MPFLDSVLDAEIYTYFYTSPQRIPSKVNIIFLYVLNVHCECIIQSKHINFYSEMKKYRAVP